MCITKQFAGVEVSRRMRIINGGCRPEEALRKEARSAAGRRKLFIRDGENAEREKVERKNP